jgi:cytochrome P450
MMQRGRQQLGDIFQVRLGGHVLVIVSHPDSIHDVLLRQTEHIRKPDEVNGMTLLSLALGDSVLTTDGPSWLARRRLMQPVFHRQRIHAMGETMVDAGARMLARWEALGDGAQLNLAHEMKRVTLDIINRTMFSVDIGDGADSIGGLVDGMLDFMIGFARQPIHPPLKWPLPANRRFLRARATMQDYLDRIIAARRASGEQHNDLLDMLLAARDEETGQGMTNTQVRNEIATIFAAGHETTALALTWTWHALNDSPEALLKLRAEVDQVLLGRPPRMEDLPKLPYTLAVLEEAMRLYPPVPLTVRKAYAPVRLGGYDVQAGDLIALSLANAHRHPDFWRQPELFQPERFLPENKAQLKREAYLPFLTGGHMCVGMNFALMEGQLLLAQMAQRFEIERLPGQVIKKQVAITMRPQNGLLVALRPRTRTSEQDHAQQWSARDKR